MSVLTCMCVQWNLLRGKIALSWSCKDHRAWHYLECPLKEVPLLVYVCGLSTKFPCVMFVYYTYMKYDALSTRAPISYTTCMCIGFCVQLWCPFSNLKILVFIPSWYISRWKCIVNSTMVIVFSIPEYHIGKILQTPCCYILLY